MKTLELKDDMYIVEWFSVINASEHTVNNYLGAMKAYTKFTGKMPEELIEDAENEIKLGVLPRKRMLKKHLIDFRKSLQDKNLADKTVQLHVAAVRSFYKAFEIEVPELKYGKPIQTLEENMPIPSKSDLQTALKVCDLFEKALLLVGVSSGLSASDIAKLTVKQFRDGYDKESGITTLHIRRTKTNFDFITFLTPETSQCLIDYLNYRNRVPKIEAEDRHNNLMKQRVYSDDNYLFCKYNIPEEYRKTKDESLRQLNEDIILRSYRSISRKAGMNAKKGSFNLLRSHNVRRFFNSALLNAGLDIFHVDLFCGHKLDDTRMAYFRASPEKLREVYARYIPYLTIAPEKDISESPEYQKIKNENQILQAETARHVVERSELIEMQRKMKNMNDFLIAIAKGDEKATEMLHFLREKEDQ